MKIQIKSTVNVPDRNYLSYFSEHIAKYQAFKRGEVVDFPEEIVEKLRSVTVINESGEDGTSIIEVVEEVVVEEKAVSEVSASVEEGVDDAESEGEAIDYFTELVNLDRVGPSTASDIMDAYPERETLIQALTDGTANEFPSQILSTLEEHYLG